MNKISKEATLRLLLQGLWKGLQEAKSDPLVQEKYPKGLGFLEGLVLDLGKKAKRDPNFSLSQKQVNLLNKFLSGKSGVLSAVLRRHIVRHCKGNQCTMVSPSEFRFEYVAPKKETFMISGELDCRWDVKKTNKQGKISFPAKPYEKLSDFLKDIIDDYRSASTKVIGKMKGIDSQSSDVDDDGDQILWFNSNEWDYDYFQTEQINLVYLSIFVNGKQLTDKDTIIKAAKFFHENRH